MKNILNSEELITLDRNLEPVKRPIIMQMITFIIGVAGVFFGVHINAPEYVCYMLAVGGFIISLVSLGLIFSHPHEIINRKTHEILHKHKLYFHSKEEIAITELLYKGNLNTLIQKAANNGPLLTIIYSSTNKSYYIAQIFKFVPYEYQPYSEPIIFNKS